MLAQVISALSTLAGTFATALGGIVTQWVMAIPFAFFIVGLAASFVFRIMGARKRRKRG